MFSLFAATGSSRTLSGSEKIMQFSVSRWEQVKLWDYGWFDVSTFTVSNAANCDANAVLDEFCKSPIFARSFCTRPDPWGAKLVTHGPFFLKTFSSDWYHSVQPNELRNSVHHAIARHDFKPPLTHNQRAFVNRFADSPQTNYAWHLNAPDNIEIRVEHHFIWWAFDEFISYNENAQNLTVGVVGYD